MAGDFINFNEYKFVKEQKRVNKHVRYLEEDRKAIEKSLLKERHELLEKIYQVDQKLIELQS
tara:strand:- start:38 stop:223 length:186 start_codon:yes stop_codon:yes gene_type:complete